jgi:peroxiredoxin
MFPRSRFTFSCTLFLSWGIQQVAWAQGAIVPAADILERYRPIQAVDIETPDKADWGKCVNKVAQIGKGSGYVVTGPQGQVLRRFVDLDGNQSVDQYRYYKDGIEVYREIDASGNPKAPSVDQFRWFNTGGTRWGVDTNKDGVIDQWKIISAEEVSMEAVRALATGDARFLTPLLVTPEDLTAIGVEKGAQAAILKPLENAERGLAEIVKQSKSIKKTTRWMQFNCAMPYMVPAEPGKSAQDLYLYENAIAIIQNGNETGSVHLGEIVRVGNTWKLTVLPRPVEGQESFVAEGGGLFQPNTAMNTSTANTPDGSLKPEIQQLIDAIKKIDEAMPGPEAKPAEVEKYHATRFQYLAKLAEVSGTPDERDSWRRQLIEGIFAATQMGAYSGGLPELQRIEAQFGKSSKEEPIYPFTVFRRILTGYMLDLQKAEVAERQKVQDELMKSLEEFAANFPTAEDRPDALLQIAVTQDLNAKAPEAVKWYELIAKDHPQSRAAIQAKGAIRRLSLKGQKLELSGALLGGGKVDVAQYRGKVLVVTYWTTYCTDCTKELPLLIEMYNTNKAAGMEVLGVNVDMEGQPIQEHVQQHKVPWPHISEPGGMQGAPALSYGILTLPTTFIVDKTGTVAAVTNSMEDVKKIVPELLKQ